MTDTVPALLDLAKQQAVAVTATATLIDQTMTQHGVVSIVAGVTASVAFSPAFSVAPHVALGSRDSTNVPWLTTAPTTTGCTIGVNGAPNLDVDWIAVGPR